MGPVVHKKEGIVIDQPVVFFDSFQAFRIATGCCITVGDIPVQGLGETFLLSADRIL